jgi:hypothetical protein
MNWIVTVFPSVGTGLTAAAAFLAACFTLPYSLAHSSTVQIGAKCSYGTPVGFQRTARRYIQK